MIRSDHARRPTARLNDSKWHPRWWHIRTPAVRESPLSGDCTEKSRWISLPARVRPEAQDLPPCVRAFYFVIDTVVPAFNLKFAASQAWPLAELSALAKRTAK